MRIPCIAAAMALFGVAPAAWGGWVVTYQEEGSNKTSQVLVQDGKLASEEMIVTGDALILIDRKAKKYWRGAAEEICSTMKQMMEEMRAAMPPAMKQKMAMAAMPQVTREEIGTAEIAGYQAQGYRFLMGGKPASEIWVSKDPKLAGLLAEAKRAEAVASEVGACMKSPMMAMMGGGDVSQTKAYEEVMEGAWVMKEPSSVSMHMTTRGGGQGSMKIRFKTVVSIEQKDVPASAFEPPEGFERVESFQDLAKEM